MNIRYRNNGRALILSATISNLAIAWMVRPALAHSLVNTLPKLNLDDTLSQTATDNSERFMHEQLHDSNSNIATPLQKDGWSQPIGWLFGLMFVILGSIAAWSKYARKR